MQDPSRIRISWSPRSERPWCPGATRPSVRDTEAGQTGWTAFLKKSVTQRFKRRGEEIVDLDEVTPPLPAPNPDSLSPR